MSKDTQPDCVPDRFYTVVSGDTCDIISQKTGTSTFQLSHANPDVINEECSNLYPGEVLCLGREGQDCRDVHTVQPGDTCSDIAEDAGTTLEILLANNPNVDPGCTNIYPGEVSPRYLQIAREDEIMRCSPGALHGQL
ncbi:hypothetical protein GY45DRAFT_1253110 [Cubamyces sp. BRFM 1775]|nr:hypothetical protein GY45DRAFT_1253110 [Cubamyces sp. BRFM 1775]